MGLVWNPANVFARKGQRTDRAGPTLFWVVGTTGLAGAACSSGSEGLVWDRTIAAKFYCIGTLTAGSAPVVYSITGNYAAHVIPFLDEPNPTVTVTVESTNLDTMVSTFTAADTPKFAVFPALPVG